MGKQKDLFKQNKENLINYFRLMLNYQNELNIKIEEKNIIVNKKQATKNAYMTPPNKVDVKFFHIICTILLYILFISLTWSKKWPLDSLLKLAAVFAGFWGFIPICGIVSRLTYPLRYFKWKKKNKKLLPQYEKDMDEYDREIECLENSINDIEEKISSAYNDSLHEDYYYVPILESFVNYLQKGRCDNLKECINLYETEMANEKLNKRIDNVESSANKSIKAFDTLVDSRRGNKTFDEATNEIEYTINK